MSLIFIKENMGAINPKELELFRNYLKIKGFSVTLQRKEILAEVFKTHEHFEAEDIVVRLRGKGSKVSRATLYRTLTHLEECGLIRKIDFGHGHAHFEHILDHKHHEHLYCMQCGKIIEFDDKALETEMKKIIKKHEFTERLHTIKIFGLCKKCCAGRK
jgi:Fur family ferric uptake transcriptional regulator